MSVAGTMALSYEGMSRHQNLTGPLGARVPGVRDHPRIPLALGVSLTLPDGSAVTGTTDNVSCAGFQMRGSLSLGGALFAGTHQPGPRERRQVDAVLRGTGNEAVTIRVRCAAVFARRVAENQVQVGFQFLDLEPASLEWLESRIATGLRQGPRS